MRTTLEDALSRLSSKDLDWAQVLPTKFLRLLYSLQPEDASP